MNTVHELYIGRDYELVDYAWQFTCVKYIIIIRKITFCYKVKSMATAVHGQ